MIYYICHMYMDVPQYVCADVPSEALLYGIFYHTLHTYIDVP